MAPQASGRGAAGRSATADSGAAAASAAAEIRVAPDPALNAQIQQMQEQLAAAQQQAPAGERLGVNNVAQPVG